MNILEIFILKHVMLSDWSDFMARFDCLLDQRPENGERNQRLLMSTCIFNDTDMKDDAIIHFDDSVGLLLNLVR